ncbi:MAG: sporulation transcriptional regulator SpoIIID [Clostridia bacterium]|nr:sporulation transcriptional regulator SpoIIID [Clostridia bacterium]
MRKDYASIAQRIVDEADYCIRNKSTIRQTAKKFGISKSIVHDDITNGLIALHLTDKATKVRQILDHNKAEAPNRGGMATKRKYAALATSKSK